MAEDGQSFEFGYLEFSEMLDLRNRDYPLDLQQQAAAHFSQLERCPDIYDEYPCVFFLRHDDEIASSVTTLPDTLSVNDKTYKWSWSGSLETKPQYRGKGLATRLILDLLRTLHDRDIIRGSAFSADATMHIYGNKIPATNIGCADRLLMVKSAKPVFDYHLNNELLAAVATSGYNSIARTIFPMLEKATGLPGTSIEVFEIPVEALLGQYRELFDNQYYDVPFHFNDTAEKLAWKMSIANATQVIYVVRSKSDGIPLSYFIAREIHVDQPLGGKYSDFELFTVMHYGFFRKQADAYQTLLHAILKVFNERSVDILELITSSTSFSRRLGRFLLRSVGKGMSFTSNYPPQIEKSLRANSLDDWHLTHYCGDGFSIT